MANIIGIIISILLIVALTHPQWLPFSAETVAKIQDLRAEHFLIERSGKITLAHFATLILALAVVWLIFTIIKKLLYRLCINLIDRRFAPRRNQMSI